MVSGRACVNAGPVRRLPPRASLLRVCSPSRREPGPSVGWACPGPQAVSPVRPGHPCCPAVLCSPRGPRATSSLPSASLATGPGAGPVRAAPRTWEELVERGARALQAGRWDPRGNGRRVGPRGRGDAWPPSREEDPSAAASFPLSMRRCRVRRETLRPRPLLWVCIPPRAPHPAPRGDRVWCRSPGGLGTRPRPGRPLGCDAVRRPPEGSHVGKVSKEPVRKPGCGTVHRGRLPQSTTLARAASVVMVNRLCPCFASSPGARCVSTLGARAPSLLDALSRCARAAPGPSGGTGVRCVRVGAWSWKRVVFRRF